MSNSIDVAQAFTTIDLQYSGADSLIPVSGRESIVIFTSSQGLRVIDQVVVLWMVIFGILGITILSFSTEINTSERTGAVFFAGKNQYCTIRDIRNAIANRFIRRSLSIFCKLINKVYNQVNSLLFSTLFYFFIEK